ncbi:hypothetical protein ABW20_dc0102090 [Dactylellina cionopaga]|nr:hypothetical protein ABW20_dc0102090 [Dactylellina cionopaga]
MVAEQFSAVAQVNARPLAYACQLATITKLASIQPIEVWQDKLSALGVAAFPWEPELASKSAPKTEGAEGENITVNETRVQPNPETDPPPLPVPLCQPLSNYTLNIPCQEDSSSLTSATTAVLSAAPKPLQTDGKDMNKDALTSDLNDSDEDREDTPQILLCAYHRVQRNRQKWKCMFRNLILQVNGRE